MAWPRRHLGQGFPRSLGASPLPRRPPRSGEGLTASRESRLCLCFPRWVKQRRNPAKQFRFEVPDSLAPPRPAAARSGLGPSGYTFRTWKLPLEQARCRAHPGRRVSRGSLQAFCGLLGVARPLGATCAPRFRGLSICRTQCLECSLCPRASLQPGLSAPSLLPGLLE